MNWYKKANGPELDFLSYNSYGELKVSINNDTYVYYNISPVQANKLKWMIEKSTIPSGVILQKYLKQFSNPEKYEKLNPSENYTYDDKLKMIDQLHEEGHLS